MKRATTDSYVITVRLLINNKTEKYLNKCFFYAFLVQNQLIKYAKKQYNRLLLDPEYKNSSGAKRREIIKKYNLSTYDFEKYAKVLHKKYKNYLGSLLVQSIASRVGKSVNDLLFKKGKQLHFKKLKDIDTISNKNNESKLIYDNGVVTFNNIKFKLSKHLPKNSYINEALKKDRVKFIRIKRKSFNNGYHYYVELVMEGVSPKQVEIGQGDCGIDIGPSTIAVSTPNCCMLEELAPLSKVYDKKIQYYQRKMDSSKRNSNPCNYNDDGTIKRGKKTWAYTKNYYKYLWLLRNIYRQKSAYIKQSHNKLANKIAKTCSDIFIEDMDFKALAKKTKETKRQEKVSIVKGKEIHKYKRKKRFGKSITNRAPSMLINTIKHKIERYGTFNEVNTKSFKASQYNHITNIYEKKKLYERNNIINNQWIQRDLYSAFLLMNSDKTLTKPNRCKCKMTFKNFVKLHNECIENIKQENIKQNKKNPSSFGF